MTKWLSGPDVHIVDLSVENDFGPGAGFGPFGSNGSYMGTILHVNAGNTQSSFFKAYNTAANPNSVVPNFQVHKASTGTHSGEEGGVWQFLPFDWQPYYLPTLTVLTPAFATGLHAGQQTMSRLMRR